MIGFSMNDLLGVLAKILNAFTQVMKWMEILVLPNEDEKVNYPTKTTEPAADETPAEP